MYLATTGERATAARVAEVHDVSVNHMAKAAHHLARLGYVRSIRGIGGGIELAKTPDAIRLGEVIEALEGNMHMLECVCTPDVCTIQSFCKLKGALAEAERVQLAYLNTVTLADIAPTKRQMVKLEA